MLRQTLGITALALAAAAAAPARADIMRWFWEVEVNGEAVDADEPIVVDVGDQLDIVLWAGFEPYRSGFSGSAFAVDADGEFFVTGVVTIDEAAGYGRNPLLAELTNAPGTIADTDDDGVWDAIDNIGVLQLPMYWEDNGDWRDPLPVYAMRWDVMSVPTQRTTLTRGATSDGMLFSTVYSDIYGNSTDYEEINSTVIIVPTTGTAVVMIAAVGMRCRRIRRG